MLVDIQPIDPSVRTESLTDARIDGNGTFDVLMRAFKGHIDEEFGKNRIKGAEYSQVYLGGLQAVMSTALQLTLQQRTVTLSNQLQEEQIKLAVIEQRKAEATILQIEAQTQLVQQQRTNLIDDLLTSAKQREKLTQEILNLQAQLPLIQAQVVEMQKRGELIDQQILNARDDLLTSIEQRKKIIQEVVNLAASLPLIQAQVASQVKQGQLIDQQVLKMQAEVLTEQSTRARIAQEVILMAQKVETERAQTIDSVAGPGSVIGRQQALYQAQTAGFQRDAEQKAAQILVDTWKIRRTTDEATVADSTNGLSDAVIGFTVLNMLRQAGVPGV